MEKIKIRNLKLDICKTCEKYNAVTTQCKECGCFMPVKTWIKGNTCPLGKHDISIDIVNNLSYEK